MRVRATITFTMEYDVNKEYYPKYCKELKDFIAVDEAAIKDDYTFVLESKKTKMDVNIQGIK